MLILSTRWYQFHLVKMIFFIENINFFEISTMCFGKM